MSTTRILTTSMMSSRLLVHRLENRNRSARVTMESGRRAPWLADSASVEAGTVARKNVRALAAESNRLTHPLPRRSRRHINIFWKVKATSESDLDRPVGRPGPTRDNDPVKYVNGGGDQNKGKGYGGKGGKMSDRKGKDGKSGAPYDRKGKDGKSGAPKGYGQDSSRYGKDSAGGNGKGKSDYKGPKGYGVGGKGGKSDYYSKSTYNSYGK